MKELLISDIHGNLEALEEVLSLERWNKVYCMGDLVDYGPNPEECVQLIRKISTSVVRGNHDNAVAFDVDCRCGYEIKELSQEVRKFTVEEISEGIREYLGRLPLVDTIDNKFLTHGVPENMFSYIKPDTPEDEFSAFSEVERDTVLLGHSHIPMDRKIGEKRFVNPGSLGQPRDGDRRGAYAFFEGGELIFSRIEYDIDTTVDKMKEANLPSRAIRILRAGRVVP